MTVSVLLATSEPAHRKEFGDTLDESDEVAVVAYVERSSELGEAVVTHTPDVVVLDDVLEPRSAADTARSLLAQDPAAAVVLWTDHATPETLADALDNGLRGVLTRPLSGAEATAKILSAAEWSQRLRANHGEQAEAVVAGTTVAVFGAKGGVGTSTLAIQLARLATAPAQTTVLVDFDLAGGDLVSLLDLSHQRSVLDLVPVADHLNARYLADALYAHPSGMRVLPAPTHSERADELTERVARRVLGALRALFPVVVVDCGSRLDEANAVALEIADHAVLVVTPEVPCLLAARRHLATLSRLSIRSDDRVLAVVNRQSRRSELQLPAIRRTLGIPVSQATVPDREAAFYAAVNDADPHRVDDRAVVGALRKLGRQVGLVHGEGPDEAAHSTRAGRPWRARRPA